MLMLMLMLAPAVAGGESKGGLLSRDEWWERAAEGRRAKSAWWATGLEAERLLGFEGKDWREGRRVELAVVEPAAPCLGREGSAAAMLLAASVSMLCGRCCWGRE